MTHMQALLRLTEPFGTISDYQYELLASNRIQGEECYQALGLSLPSNIPSLPAELSEICKKNDDAGIKLLIYLDIPGYSVQEICQTATLKNRLSVDIEAVGSRSEIVTDIEQATPTWRLAPMQVPNIVIGHAHLIKQGQLDAINDFAIRATSTLAIHSIRAIVLGNLFYRNNPDPLERRIPFLNQGLRGAEDAT